MSAFAVASLHSGAGTASKALTVSECVSSSKEISDLVSLSLFESHVASGLLLNEELVEESTPPDPDPVNGDPKTVPQIPATAFLCAFFCAINPAA